ncbi:MAG: hypothetical protein V1760_02815 [Candidatus Peregrinibacteria bacterium]
MQCQQCQSSFEVLLDEKEFLKKMDFRYGNTIVSLSEPTVCPACRNQIRTAQRNEQYLYQRKSALSGQQIISIHDPLSPWGKGYKVYSPEEWHGDGWDSLDYGCDFDFNRPFFEQFNELLRDVPKLSLMQVANENSPYTTGTGYCKNCHLINSSEYCEDCYYGKLFQRCKDCMDSAYLYDSELCYECFNCRKCHHCVHLYYSQNCSDCWFSENLTGCRNCFFCTNLTNKQYYFMNEPLPKKEWEKRVEEFKGSHRNFVKAKEVLDKLRQKRVHKYADIMNSENCTGDFIRDSRHCLHCFDMNDSQDCRYVWVGVELKDVYDCSNMYVRPELNYQVMGTIETFHVAFALYVFHSQNVLYSDSVFHSKDIFGCVGLKKKQYCVFNKQYTKAQYEELAPKIIDHMRRTGEWGQFFPPAISPFGYNGSLASEYYPLDKKEVISRGWQWHEDSEKATYQGPRHELPDPIKDVPDEVTQWILECETSGKLYKIMPQELKVYKTMGLPLPRRAPDQRHKDRMTLRNLRQVYSRKCGKCGTGVATTFAPDRPEKIYCEKCYLEAVY